MERTLSQLLPGANKVVNALRLRTKAFIAGLIQRRWTPWSKPKHGFDNYHNKDNKDSYIISFLIRSQINNIIIKQTLTVKEPRKVIIKLLKLGCPSTFKGARAPIILEGSSTHYFRGLEHSLI